MVSKIHCMSQTQSCIFETSNISIQIGGFALLFLTNLKRWISHSLCLKTYSTFLDQQRVSKRRSASLQP